MVLFVKPVGFRYNIIAYIGNLNIIYFIVYSFISIMKWNYNALWIVTIYMF